MRTGSAEKHLLARGPVLCQGGAHIESVADTLSLVAVLPHPEPL